jgi:hypothetical protein
MARVALRCIGVRSMDTQGWYEFFAYSHTVPNLSLLLLGGGFTRQGSQHAPSRQDGSYSTGHLQAQKVRMTILLAPSCSDICYVYRQFPCHCAEPGGTSNGAAHATTAVALLRVSCVSEKPGAEGEMRPGELYVTL